MRIYKAKLTDIKGEINSNKITVRDSNTPLSSMDISSRQKINKETQALSGTLDQIGLIDIYRTFHLKAAEYTFFSSALGTFSRLTTCWATKEALVSLRKLKSYQASFPTRIL